MIIAPQRRSHSSRSLDERRIFVRLPNWIGDAIMAWGALEPLARSSSRHEWLLSGPGHILELFRGVDPPFWIGPELAGVSAPADALLASALAVRATRSDAALVFPPSFSSAFVPTMAGVPLRVGWPSDLRGALLTHPGERPDRRRSLRAQMRELVERMRSALGAPDLVSDPLQFNEEPARLPLRAEELAWADRWFSERAIDGRRAVALAPGATFGATKRWPASSYAQLARDSIDVGERVLWFGGPAEETATRLLHESLAPAARARSHVLAGSISLRESLALLSGLRAMVSNDSGAMHLAQAAGCPVLGIFGSTSPQWTGPIGRAQRVVSHPITCAPCFRSTCPTQIECLSQLSVAAVSSELRALLDATERTSPRPALFLDRDGTLIELVPYLTREDQVVLTAGAADALRRAQSRGWALVVVTNQSAVARGRLSPRGLQRVHARLLELLAAEGVQVDGIEFCPHHPNFGGSCACRKPAPGLFRRAAHRLDLDLEASFALGDTVGDLDAAQAAGVRAALVRTGYGRETERQRPEALCFDDVASAVDALLFERTSAPAPSPARVS